MTMPLEGITVVDLSRLAPGPYASMLLGDLGADVILVEAPAGSVSAMGGGGDDEAAQRRRAHNALARNKRSIVVNLKEEAGREVVHRLASSADVFLEGFRPGVVDRLGVGYEAIAETNPRIVYCSLSGYGQTGPYSQMVGHDINYISIGGALGMIGRPGQKPAIPYNVIADFAGGGLMSAFSILAALMARDRTGRGQYLDMSMSDNVLYLLASQTAGVLAGGPPPVPGARGLGGGSPHYDAYECADGKFLSLGSLEPHFWANLCEVVGRPDMQPHEFDASKHEEFKGHLERTFKTKTRDEWFAELRDIDLCVAPVLTLDEALEDEHQRARGMVVEVDDPRAGTVRQVGIGPKFSDTPGQVRTTAPTPGQHTEELLAGLGYEASDIASMREQGAVG
ncbi:MAG: CoA transferase [Dehalococcoidia bacterium]|nr:CoA transferase [Dehalococcoidia bacterium]